MRGRVDLNVYVLNCLQCVDVMLVPHVLSCASHAASEVAYKRGRAKFRVEAERLFFSVVKHGLHQCFAGARRGRSDLPAREHVAY